MTTIYGDNGDASWRKFDIDCQDALPVSIAFTDDPKVIVSSERNSNHHGGRLLQYNIPPDPFNQKNTPKNPDPIALDGVDSTAISKDGKWVVIISGTTVTVRNMTTDEVVQVDEHKSGVPVHAVDISPDSTDFATGSEDKVVRVFSINTGRLLLKLSQHNHSILGVKYSTNGQYLATVARGESIRVWDARNKYTLLRTSSSAIHFPSFGVMVDAVPLGWSNHGDRVFTVSHQKVVVFQSSLSVSPNMPCYHYYYRGQSPQPGEVVSFLQPVPSNNSDLYSLATNGRIIVYSAGNSLTFWDTFSSSQIGPTVTLKDSILCLALSHDGSYLACGKGSKKITVYSLRDILPSHAIIDPTSHLPLIDVDYPAFQGWLESVTGRILWKEKRPCVHSLVNQALIQAHTQSWYLAVENAKNALSSEPSIIGRIALIRALVGQGQQELAFDTFDAVFCTCGADEVKFLLLIKAILLFLSGKRENAVTRVRDIISSIDDSAKYNYLQVLGNMYLIQGDLKEAFETFERARALSFYRRDHHLMTILLIFGLNFGEREVTHRYPWMEAITA